MRATLALLLLTSLVAAYAAGYMVRRAEDPHVAMIESFRMALAEGDPLERAHRFNAYLEGLEAESLPQLLETLEARQHWLVGYELRSLMIAWTRFDPPGALDWALSRPGRLKSRAAGAAIYAWGFHDPQAALEALSALDRREPKVLLEEQLVFGWLQSRELEGAAQYISRKAGSMMRQKFVNALTTELMRDGPDAVIAWVEAIPDDAVGRYKKIAFQKASNVLATVDPSGTARWIEGHLQHEYSGFAAASIAKRWVEKDPATAIEWLLSLPEGSAETQAVPRTFNDWLAQNPGEAEAWLREASPSQPTDELVRVLVSRDRTLDPAAALEWAGQIHDPRVQRKVMIGVARDWYHKKPEQAGIWLAESGLSDDYRAIIEGPTRKRGTGKPGKLSEATNGRASDGQPSAPPLPTEPAEEETK